MHSDTTGKLPLVCRKPFLLYTTALKKTSRAVKPRLKTKSRYMFQERPAVRQVKREVSGLAGYYFP